MVPGVKATLMVFPVSGVADKLVAGLGFVQAGTPVAEVTVGLLRLGLPLE